MTDDKIVKMILDQRAQGTKDKRIKKNLIDNGLDKMKVYAAFVIVDTLKGIEEGGQGAPRRKFNSMTWKIITAVVVADIIFWIIFAFVM